jgi:hypothetical protein
MIAEVLLAHLVGDYLFQNHWMAVEKVKRWWPALVHGITYTLPFILITQSIPALLIICLTHVIIDRYRLAKHFVWAKNQLAPHTFRPPHTDTGFDPNTPPFLAVWLMIITDNILHILINISAILLF